jgi:hypothetical protein
MTVYVDVLMDELAAGMPHLPGARCAGRHELFDATAEGSRTGPAGAAEVAAARSEALRLCGGCPELGPCRAWLSGLRKRDRPNGVVAGRVIGDKRKLKAKDIAA